MAETAMVKTGEPGLPAAPGGFTINTSMAMVIADELADIVRQREKRGVQLVVNVGGKKYPTIPCWQIVGAQLMVFPHTVWTKPENPNEIAEAWKDGRLTAISRCVLRTAAGVEVGSGEAVCSQAERMKGQPRWQDAYAVISMAQTRAIGKAYRNGFGWVLQMAGIEATPAEEIPPDGFKNAPTVSDGAGDVDTVISDAEVKRIMASPASREDRDEEGNPVTVTLIDEDTRRAFIWTVALKLHRGDKDGAEGWIRQLGTFKGKDGKEVVGPLPYETKRDGSYRLGGKWLNRVFDAAKDGYALMTTDANGNYPPIET
jgi:hypothetical protein